MSAAAIALGDAISERHARRQCADIPGARLVDGEWYVPLSAYSDPEEQRYMRAAERVVQVLRRRRRLERAADKNLAAVRAEIDPSARAGAKLKALFSRAAAHPDKAVRAEFLRLFEGLDE